MAIDYTRRSGESTPSQAPVSLSKITLHKIGADGQPREGG